MQTMTIIGRVKREDDPMHREGNDPIRRVVEIKDLPECLNRWASLGREIVQCAVRDW
jgi:hypothetical protein